MQENNAEKETFRNRAAAEKIQKQVGAQVRQLRKARGVTLQQLAARAGVSVGYLSEMERNLTAASIKSLFDISRGLGVNVGWFFSTGDEGPEEEKGIVVRASRRRLLSYDNHVQDYLLSPDLAGKLEMLLCRFAPGASSGDIPYAHEREESGVVLSGCFEISIDDRHFRLEEGDSFRFTSASPHRYRNPGDDEAVVIWVITPPGF